MEHLKSLLEGEMVLYYKEKLFNFLGCVRVWDPRQKSPVLSLEPAEKQLAVPDCWAVG